MKKQLFINIPDSPKLISISNKDQPSVPEEEWQGKISRSI